jgi:hypothetical protein
MENAMKLFKTCSIGWPAGLLALALAATTTPSAMADAYNFSFSGSGLSGSGTLSLSPTSTPGTDTVTGISGYFMDSNPGASFSGAITGLELAPPPATPPPFNAPAFTNAGFSYDNLFYPNGQSPLVCIDYPFGGGVFDSYGVVFDIAGGYTAELWSDGVFPGDPNPVYAAGDSFNGTQLEPNVMGAGVPISVNITPTPEPSSLALLGTGALGLFGLWKRVRPVAPFGM